VDEHGIAGAGCRQRAKDRLRAHQAALHADGSLGGGHARGQCDDDPLDRGHTRQDVDAPLNERPAGERYERLGTVGPETLAAPGGEDQRDSHRNGHLIGELLRTRWRITNVNNCRVRESRYLAATASWLEAEFESRSSR
jgi:hypothetical protein